MEPISPEPTKKRQLPQRDANFYASLAGMSSGTPMPHLSARMAITERIQTLFKLARTGSTEQSSLDPIGEIENIWLNTDEDISSLSRGNFLRLLKNNFAHYAHHHTTLPNPNAQFDPAQLLKEAELEEELGAPIMAFCLYADFCLRGLNFAAQHFGRFVIEEREPDRLQTAVDAVYDYFNALVYDPNLHQNFVASWIDHLRSSAAEERYFSTTLLKNLELSAAHTILGGPNLLNAIRQPVSEIVDKIDIEELKRFASIIGAEPTQTRPFTLWGAKNAKEALTTFERSSEESAFRSKIKSCCIGMLEECLSSQESLFSQHPRLSQLAMFVDI